MSSRRNTRARSFLSGPRDEVGFSVRARNAHQKLKDTVESVRQLHIRRKTVSTPRQGVQIGFAGATSAAPAPVSESGVCRGHRDSVLELWLKYDAYFSQPAAPHNLDSIPTSLRPGNGRVVNGRAGARGLYPPRPVPQARRDPDTTQRRLPNSSSADPQTHNRNPTHGQRLSPPQLPNTATGNFLNHDEFSFDTTRFRYPVEQINDDERDNRRANFPDAPGYIEAEQLDTNVAEHLKAWVPEPYLAPWDHIVQGVRQAMSSYLWGE